MKVTQVKCPQCDLPIYMRQKDDFFYCSSCGTIHVRGIHGVERIPYEIANFRPGTPLDDCHYIPFWRLQCDFQIKSRSVEEDIFTSFPMPSRAAMMVGSSASLYPLPIQTFGLPLLVCKPHCQQSSL